MRTLEVATEQSVFCDGCLVPQLINHYIAAFCVDSEVYEAGRAYVIIAEKSAKDIGAAALSSSCGDIPKVLPALPVESSTSDELMVGFKACPAFGDYLANQEEPARAA